jgi:hypothetical protein
MVSNKEFIFLKFQYVLNIGIIKYILKEERTDLKNRIGREGWG